MVMRMGCAKEGTLVSEIPLARGRSRVEDPGGSGGRQWSSFDQAREYGVSTPGSGSSLFNGTNVKSWVKGIMVLPPN